MIDFAEIADGEKWELFARDFPVDLGFYIESSPDRGADGGKDVLVTEELAGKLGNYKFRWLVSCKHNAHSGKAVNEAEEQNILERVEGFGANGFMGFYSTVPSSGLNSRLRALRDSGKIRDFRIFDHELIENYLVRVGYATLLMRYFPESYKAVKPLHALTDEYLPLQCRVCKKDLLESLYDEPRMGLVGFVRSINEDSSGPRRIEEVYWACKIDCDDYLQDRYRQKGMLSSWQDIGDLAIPIFYLRFVFSVMNLVRSGNEVYTDLAYQQLQTLILTLAQRVLRETTEKERKQFITLLDIESLMT